MPGRLWAQTSLLVGEGISVLIFYNMKSLAGAIVVLVFFSCFVQSAEGTSFGIVPYMDPPHTGSVTGIVGAGGNVGAVGFGLAFRQLDSRSAFKVMGITILASSFLCLFMDIKGEETALCGRKKHHETQGLEETSNDPSGSKREVTPP
jgi:NNP family nitrate/nitrite transporter-like MFS transporter